MAQLFDGFTVDPDKEVAWFRNVLTNSGLSPNTVDSYCWTLQRFLEIFENEISPGNLITFKENLIATSEPQSVNNRIHGMNRYLKDKGIDYKLMQVKIVDDQFNDKVISLEDYSYLKRRLKEDKNYYDYFLIWAMGCTGARVSEILQLKVEHIYDGIFRIYGKGTKTRTVFLSQQFCRELKDYLKDIGRDDGYIFSRGDKVISKGSVEVRIKKLAYKYNIDPEVVYPHSFRHMFAKAFNRRENDLVLLKDIMGHSSIETTVMYCKPSLKEILDKYNRIVDW